MDLKGELYNSVSIFFRNALNLNEAEKWSKTFCICIYIYI